MAYYLYVTQLHTTMQHVNCSAMQADECRELSFLIWMPDEYASSGDVSFHQNSLTICLIFGPSVIFEQLNMGTFGLI